MAVWKLNRYKYHGGEPALGALYGAVNASPSTSAGQPPWRYMLETRSSVGRSVTRVASPSSTKSKPSSLIEIVQAGRMARLRDLRVAGPLVKYRSPSNQTAPIPAACGRPPGRDVPRNVAVPGPRWPAARRSCGLLHGSGEDP